MFQMGNMYFLRSPVHVFRQNLRLGSPKRKVLKHMVSAGLHQFPTRWGHVVEALHNHLERLKQRHSRRKLVVLKGHRKKQGSLYFPLYKTSPPPRDTHLSWAKKVMFKTAKKGNMGTPFQKAGPGLRLSFWRGGCPYRIQRQTICLPTEC